MKPKTKSDTKEITKVFVNVPKLNEESLSQAIEEGNTVLAAACVSLVCCFSENKKEEGS